MWWGLFVFSFYAQDVAKSSAANAVNTQNSLDNAKKKPAKYWKTKGNKNIDSTKHFLGTKDFNPLIIKTNATERMRITSSGNIGIGTAVPNYPFEVQVSAFVKTLSADYVHVGKGLTVGDLHFCRGNNCNVDTVHTTQQRDLLLRSNNLLGLFADTVRIAPGTGSSAKLQINGTLATKELYLSSAKINKGNLLALDSSNQVVGIDVKLAFSGGNSGCSHDYVLSWGTPKIIPAGVPFNSIAKYPKEGNTGIGVCVPNAKLHICNLNESKNVLWLETGTAIKETNFIVTDQSKVGIGIRAPSAVLDVFCKSLNTDLLKIRDSSNTYFVINKDGAGIGTLPTSYFKLSVCGAIRSTEWVVEAGWCDYVFEEGFSPPTWQEMETYYLAHKHLPQILPAKEIEENGLPMAKSFEGLVYNVEINRLHITDIYKKLHFLEKEVSRLKKENKQLKEQKE